MASSSELQLSPSGRPPDSRPSGTSKTTFEVLARIGLRFQACQGALRGEGGGMGVVMGGNEPRVGKGPRPRPPATSTCTSHHRQRQRRRRRRRRRAPRHRVRRWVAVRGVAGRRALAWPRLLAAACGGGGAGRRGGQTAGRPVRAARFAWSPTRPGPQRHTTRPRHAHDTATACPRHSLCCIASGPPSTRTRTSARGEEEALFMSRRSRTPTHDASQWDGETTTPLHRARGGRRRCLSCPPGRRRACTRRWRGPSW